MEIRCFPFILHHHTDSPPSHDCFLNLVPSHVQSCYLPEMWIHCYGLAIYDWTSEKLEILAQCNLELKWEIWFFWYRRAKNVSPNQPGFFKGFLICRMLFNGLYCFQARSYFTEMPGCIPVFIRNKYGTLGIAKLPVKLRRAGYPFGWIFPGQRKGLFTKQTWQRPAGHPDRCVSPAMAKKTPSEKTLLRVRYLRYVRGLLHRLRPKETGIQYRRLLWRHSTSSDLVRRCTTDSWERLRHPTG